MPEREKQCVFVCIIAGGRVFCGGEVSAEEQAFVSRLLNPAFRVCDTVRVETWLRMGTGVVVLDSWCV